MLQNLRFVVALLLAVCCCCGCRKAFVVVVVAVVLAVVVVVVDIKKSGWGVQGGGRSASPRKAFAEILNDMLRLSDVDKERVEGAGRRCKALQKFGLLIDMLRLWSLLLLLLLLLLVLLLLVVMLLLWLLLLLVMLLLLFAKRCRSSGY